MFEEATGAPPSFAPRFALPINARPAAGAYAKPASGKSAADLGVPSFVGG